MRPSIRISLVLALLGILYVGNVAAYAVVRGAPAGPASVDWPSFNNDLAGSRYAALAQINTRNVTRLHAVCSAPLGAWQRFESGPVVVNGVLYVTTSSRTYAFDAATCARLWLHEHALTTGAGGADHGAALAAGRVFRGYGDGHVVALDARTGKTLWDRYVLGPGSLEYIIAAPLAWNGAVYVGTAGGDSGQACHLLALDQLSGKVLWSRQTVPAPNDPAARTWLGASRIAGGSLWTSLTLDAVAGKLYVPVSNPGPDFDIRLRGGANLYTNALAEVNAVDGIPRRAIQLVPQDAHDWDAGAAPALVTLKNGAKVALTAGKDGYLRAIDIASFAQRWKTPVTTIANANAPISPSGTHYCPRGAVLWNGPAYSPLTGYAYVNAVDWCVTVTLSATPQPYVPGHSWLGTADSYGKPDATKSGWLRAVDAVTGVTKWSYHAATPLVAAVTPTAGGLVITADLNGNILAFDASSGTLLKTIATGLPVGGGIVSYQTGGKQYVAVAAGMTSGVFGTPQVNSSVIVLGL